MSTLANEILFKQWERFPVFRFVPQHVSICLLDVGTYTKSIRLEFAGTEREGKKGKVWKSTLTILILYYVNKSLVRNWCVHAIDSGIFNYLSVKICATHVKFKSHILINNAITNTRMNIQLAAQCSWSGIDFILYYQFSNRKDFTHCYVLKFNAKTTILIPSYHYYTCIYRAFFFKLNCNVIVQFKKKNEPI